MEKMENDGIERIERIESDRTSGVILNPARKKQDSQAVYWFFTYNNYEIERIESIESILKHECDWFVFQEETGEGGTPHLQGTIKLKTPQRLTQLKAIDAAIHWEKTKAVKASIAYASKEATRTGKLISYGIEVQEPIEFEEPYGWQLQIIDIIKTKPDKRTIWWFWEPIGNVGKTTLCKYLVGKKDALMLTGKSSDMYHMISKYPNKRKLFICDIPRTAMEYVNYGAIEQMKNGLIFSGKYEGTQLLFNCPHIIVFANQEPERMKMSMDRWKIIKIST